MLTLAVVGIVARPVLSEALGSDVPPTTDMSQLSTAAPPTSSDAPTTTTIEHGPTIPGPVHDDAGRFSAALVTLDDMPAGWKVYQARPQDTFPLHRAVCGSVRRSGHPALQASTSYAQSDDTGPVFGERIAEYPLPLAKRIMAMNRSRPYPCHWTDAGIKWSESTIPAPRLCDRSFAYLQRKLSGNFPYSYEYVVRCGHDILAFVLTAERPDRKLAAALVHKAVDRYRAAGAT